MSLESSKISNVIQRPALVLTLSIIAFLSISSKSEKNINTETLDRINQIRKGRQLEKLSIDSCLCNAAWDQTNFLADKPSLSHFQDNEVKKYPNDRLNFYNCDFTFNAENLIRIYSDSIISNEEDDAKKMVKLWMSSSSHKSNIVHKKAKKTCITSKRVGNRILTVQVFTN
jgi:uncharacterized protein YkwD